MTLMEKEIVNVTINYLGAYRDMCLLVDLALISKRSDKLHEVLLLMQKDRGNSAAAVIDLLERLVASK